MNKNKKLFSDLCSQYPSGTFVYFSPDLDGGICI